MNPDIRVHVQSVRSNRALVTFIGISVVAVCAMVAVSFSLLIPARASASDIGDLFGQALYDVCHDHVDNNGGDGIDLLDPICDSVSDGAPEGFNQNLTTDAGVPVTTTLTGSDPDTTPGHPEGDILYFTISMLPQNGTLMCGAVSCQSIDAVVGNTGPGGATPNVTYIPNPGFSGDDEYDFTANDGRLEITNSDATIYIHVNATSGGNAAPVADNAALVTTKNVATSSTATGSDADSGPTALVFATSTEPAHGSVTGTFPNFTYTPNTDFVGSDSFQFTAGDGLATSTGTISITVNDTSSGGSQSSSNPQCSDGIDNDNDGRTDYPSDNSCSDGGDNSEGNDGGAFFGGSGGNPNAPSGLVLGASTDIPLCSNPLLTSFLRLGRKNNADQVMKLQDFLNLNLNAGLTVNGIFDEATHEAVKNFQLKYETEVLLPWKPFGLGDRQATGYVYKTTQRMINMLSCSNLNLPIPQLP